ncbi:MAG TPA: hypothetical protein VJV79_25680 [Polyangiaceae bacterium]|nr:hypothetical protein [Polyangiaceae bacterium]
MRRRSWLIAFVVALLPACDDAVLRAFEPHSVELGGWGGTGSGGGHGGTTAGAFSAGAAGASVGAAGSSAGAAGSPSSLLIDDFEDGDMRAKEPLGYWYPVKDGTAAQGTGIEPIGGGGANIYALRTHGSGFTDWGAGLGVNLAGDSTPLNALGYEQLCFSARIEAGTSSSIQVHLLQDPGVPYERAVSLSESWTRYCLPLANFIAADRSELVPDKLIALQFFFPPKVRFELWLDDVELDP